MPVKPMLGDLELQLVQEIETDQDRVLAQHAVPGLEGDFLQQLGRRATTIILSGVIEGEEAGAGLKALREKFQLAEPVDFVADIATASKVDKVLIEEMGTRELAGKPARFEYAFTLREYIPPPPPRTEPPPPPPPPPPNPLTGRLEVTVIVCNREDFDFSTVTVTVNGTQEDGSSLARTLSNRNGNVWTEEEFPPGTYTARATTEGPPPMQGEEPCTVRGGQLTSVTIELCPGQVPLIAKTFVVHFHFDRAFIEPCMRHVLEKVAEYSDQHPDEKMLVLGHTDLTGSAQYNQSLSERRARSVFAYLTFKGNETASLQEWDQLRRARTVGTAVSLNDSWGKREYQYILQDLNIYHGNIQTESGNTAEDEALTDAAVRQFQNEHGLTPDGIVGNDTWGALIADYLGQNPLGVPQDRLLPNAKDGCDSGKLKWLGNGEMDPVENTQDAFRPNRRTEILFVKADALPADVPEPDTNHLPGPGDVYDPWCLNRDGTSLHSCFVRPHIDPPLESCSQPPMEERWPRQPAEPGDVLVSGRIHFEDGTPLANTPYVLIAPNGTFMDGEHRPVSDPLRGWPIPGRTGPNGEFAYTTPSGIGIYTMEVRAPVVARAAGQPVEDAKGNVVCQRLQDPQSFLDIIVVSKDAVSVRPGITAPAVVVVRKPYTNPVRQPVTLRSDAVFTGSGTFTRSSDAVRFFDAALGGNEITFDGVDNVFSDAQLTAGVTLFAEGARASAALDDVELRLALTMGGSPGLSDSARMTAVELTLDICQSRTAAGTDPAPIAGAAPAFDKVNTGRFIHIQDGGNHHGRAMLIVRQAQPAAFTGDLVLAAINGSVQAFSNEVAAAGQAPLPNRQVISNAGIPAGGTRFFAQGAAVSGGLRDTGFTLGVNGLEDDGDRIAITVVQFSNLTADVPSTPANTARPNPPGPASITNSPVARHNLTVNIFDEVFTAPQTLVLVENSVPTNDRVNLSVTVAPAGVPVSWSVQRDTRPAPDGDAPGVIALSPNPAPTITPNPANALQATLLADAVGSFHIRPFVDCNATNAFEHNDPGSGARIDREPFILMNLVLIRVQNFGNNSRVRNALVATNPAPPTQAGFGVSTGVSANPFANPTVAAVNNDSTMTVTGGGRDGRRGLDRLMTGWVNNDQPVATSVTAPQGEDVLGQYLDTTIPGAPVTHQQFAIWVPPTIAPPGVLNWPAGLASSGGLQTFLPGGAPPALVSGPVLDASPFGSEGTGGDTPVGTESAAAPGPPVVPGTPASPPPQPGVVKNPAPGGIGERWQVQMWDSPGDNCPAAHPGGLPGALINYRFNLNFRTDLVVWTNITGVPTPTPDAACRLYSTVQTNTWTIRFSVAFNPATGAVLPGGANAVTLTQDANTTRRAAPCVGTGLELRGPTTLRLLGIDARA